MEGPRQPGPLFTRFWDSLIENFVFPPCGAGAGEAGGWRRTAPFAGMK